MASHLFSSSPAQKGQITAGRATHKDIFRKIFEEGMLFRTLPTTLVQIYWQFMVYLLAIFKGIRASGGHSL